jgi:hypothetical protein
MAYGRGPLNARWSHAGRKCDKVIAPGLPRPSLVAPDDEGLFP